MGAQLDESWLYCSPLCFMKFFVFPADPIMLMNSDSRRSGKAVDHLSECFALCEAIVQRYSRAGKVLSIGERLAMESMLRVLPLPASLEKSTVDRDFPSHTFDIEQALKEGSSSESGLSRILRFLEDFDDVTKKPDDILRDVGTELKKALSSPNVRLYRVCINDGLLLDSVAGVAFAMDDSTAVGKCAKEEVIFSIGTTLYVPLRVKGEFVGCIEAFGAANAPTTSMDFHHFMRAVGLVMRNVVKTEHIETDKEKAAAMVLMATRLSRDTLDESILVDSIMNTAKTLTESDRCSIFIVNDDKSLSAHFEGGHKVHLPRGTGIAGHVAETGEVVNIANAYEDVHFSNSVDKMTGYHTRTILCLPVRAEGSIVAVAQLINKLDLQTDSGLHLQRTFGKQDEELFSTFSAFAGAALRNCRINDNLAKEVEKSEAIRDVVTLLYQTDIRDMDSIVRRVLAGAKKLLNADRSALFLLDKERNELYSQIADSVTGQQIRFKNGEGIAGIVATTGKGENIEDAYSDSRFNSSVDKQLGYRTQSLLCEPITLNGEVLAVVQLVNKMNSRNEFVPFTNRDRETFKIFSLFAGISINNSHLLAFAVRAGQEAMELNDCGFGLMHPGGTPLSKRSHRLSVIRDTVRNPVLEIIVPDDITSRNFDLLRLRETSINPLDVAAAVAYNLILGTGLPQKFGCRETTLINFILQCRKLYRRVPYHNFFHVVDICQTLHTFLYEGGAHEFLTEIECYVLLICALVHDLDHMGVNNSFHLKTDSPLGILSSASGNNSVLEVHHCNLAVEILSQPESDVFEGVSEVEKPECFRALISCVLATDMAKHAEELSKFGILVASGYDKNNPDHRQCAMEILIKAGDVSNVTKPFEQSRKWAMAVTEEFHRQGDIEKEKGLDVLPMFDRAKSTELARGQIGFIDFVAAKFYKEIVGKLFTGMQWCVDNLESNRATWEIMNVSNPMRFFDKLLMMLSPYRRPM
eukprot:gene7189-5051_t